MLELMQICREHSCCDLASIRTNRGKHRFDRCSNFYFVRQILVNWLDAK
uniref:Uncharacterized protein n=1 Tax=Rhizophora mucronata TaxID=61149 RepID=A0A2P2JMF1_RHIMU